MKPVDQTILADPSRNDGKDADGVPGDCWRACIASIVELPAEEVPHFGALEGPSEWWTATWKWLATKGYRIAGRNDGEWRIGVGPSPRGPFHHAVVLDSTGALAHDPHPSRLGLVRVESTYAITPIKEEA